MTIRTDIPARALAQMRLVAQTAKLPAALATAFAEGAARRGMALAVAEQAAQAAAFLVESDHSGKVGETVLARMTDELLTRVSGGDEAEPNIIASDILLTYLAAEDAKTGPLVRGYDAYSQGHSWDSPRGLAMKSADALQAQIGVRMGLKTEPGMGRDMGEVSLAGIAMSLCRAAGLRPFNGAEAIRMAGQHTGTDFSYTITNGLSGVVARGFEAAEPAIARAASEVPAEDYRQRNSVSLSASAVPAKVVEGQKIGYTTVSEKGEMAAKPDDYATIFAISNQALQNDSTAMNLFADMGRKMVIGAVAQFRNVLLAPLVANAGLGQTMTDTLTLFHATHGNLAGAGAVPSVTTLATARTAMRRQKDAMGTILGIEPKMLLVPPELETTAQQLVAQLSAAQTSNVNPFSGQLEVVTEAGLANTTAWYLLGDPAQVQGLTYAYLEGRSAPSVENRDGWDTLGMEFRLVWAVGAAFVETASWYRNPGV